MSYKNDTKHSKGNSFFFFFGLHFFCVAVFVQVQDIKIGYQFVRGILGHRDWGCFGQRRPSLFPRQGRKGRGKQEKTVFDFFKEYKIELSIIVIHRKKANLILNRMAITEFKKSQNYTAKKQFQSSVPTNPVLFSCLTKKVPFIKNLLVHCKVL